MTPPRGTRTRPSLALRAAGVALLTVAALVPSLLPDRWRRRLPAALHGAPLSLATAVTAIVEIAAAIVGGAIAYVRFEQAWAQPGMDAMAHAIAETEHALDNGHLMGFGVITFIRFVFTPAGAAALYFFVEGVLRGLAAGLTDEGAGTLPLFLVAEGAARARAYVRRRRERERLVEDLVLAGEDGGLTIATCRARDWDELTTLALDEQLFEVAEHRVIDDDEARPHRYRLREWPAGRVVRRRHAYRTDELLRG